MRGAVPGGMALGLDELGPAQAFDAAYGSSAGTLNASGLVSARPRRDPGLDRPAAGARAHQPQPAARAARLATSTSSAVVSKQGG